MSRHNDSVYARPDFGMGRGNYNQSMADPNINEDFYGFKETGMSNKRYNL